LAFLLGLASALLAVHSYSCSRWASRPSDLERRPGLSYRIDLNQADRAELLQLPGLGETLVQRIEDYRRDRGRFQSVDQLREVQGIGPVTLERVRSWVQVAAMPDEGGSELARAAPGVSSSVRGDKASVGGAGKRKTGSKKEASLSSPVDINRASATELQGLPGIGPRISQRIVDERFKAPFKTVEDLKRVQGIGPKILERLRPYVVVRPERDRVVTAN
jgi:competence protein ComEA